MRNYRFNPRVARSRATRISEGGAVVDCGTTAEIDLSIVAYRGRRYAVLSRQMGGTWYPQTYERLPVQPEVAEALASGNLCAPTRERLIEAMTT